MSLYSYPKLYGNKILYKGRRYIMFEMNAEHPYEGYESFSSIALWDSNQSNICAFADRTSNGQLTGHLAFTMDKVEVNGDKPRQFIDETVRLWRFYVKHVEGN
jgi:uncharacterized membrane protein